MTSRTGGGGDWREEPTANIRVNKAHTIKRRPTPVENPIRTERPTQELARLEVDVLLAQPEAAVIADRQATTPRLGVKRLSGSELRSLPELDQVTTPLAMMQGAGSGPVANGTDAMLALGTAPDSTMVDIDPVRALGTDPMIALDNAVEKPAPAEDPAPALARTVSGPVDTRGPWRDLAIGFTFGVALLAGAVFVVSYWL
jgi:hypothetical protein